MLENLILMKKKESENAKFLENRFLGITVLEAGKSLIKLCNQRILRPLETEHYEIHLEKENLDIYAYTYIIRLNKDLTVFFLTEGIKKLKEAFP